MPISIATGDFHDRVVADFQHALGSDKAGFSVTPIVGSPDFDKASYVQTQHDFAKDLINDVFNTFPDHMVLVTGVDSTFVIKGKPITYWAGVTAVHKPDINPAGTGLNPGADVNILYDAENCSGKGGYRFGPKDADHPNGVVLKSRFEVTLFHELCHTYHWLNDDNGIGGIDPEVQARTDENKFRALESLPLRDVDNGDGGCCGDDPQIKCPGCLIVTAVSGSDRSSEVEAFRQVRDKILRGSLIGDRFITALLVEYHQFSPGIADNICASPSLKAAVNAFVVGPLLDFLFVFEALVRWGWQRPSAFSAIVEQTIARTLRVPACAATSHADIDSLASRLEWLSLPQPPEINISKIPEPVGPQELIDYFADRMRLGFTDMPYVRWGLVRALALYWRTVERFLASSQVDGELARGLAVDIEDWLSSAPLPPITLELSDRTLRQELDVLADSVLAIPTVRLRFERRIAAARAKSTVSALLVRAPGDDIDQRNDCGCQ